jgi:hypothetical protein
MSALHTHIPAMAVWYRQPPTANHIGFLLLQISPIWFPNLSLTLKLSRLPCALLIDAWKVYLVTSRQTFIWKKYLKKNKILIWWSCRFDMLTQYYYVMDSVDRRWLEPLASTWTCIESSHQQAESLGRPELMNVKLTWVVGRLVQAEFRRAAVGHMCLLRVPRPLLIPPHRTKKSSGLPIRSFGLPAIRGFLWM